MFTTKDSGKRMSFDSGMVRDTQEGKTLYHLIFSGPMLERWAGLLTRGAAKYNEDNWMKAEGQAEYRRFKASAARHFVQWMRGDTDEDHAAAVFFNLNGAEYVKGKLEAAGHTAVPILSDAQAEQAYAAKAVTLYGDMLEGKSLEEVEGTDYQDELQPAPQAVNEESLDGFWNVPSQSAGCWEVSGGTVLFIQNDGRRVSADHELWWIKQHAAEGGLVRNTWPIPADPAIGPFDGFWNLSEMPDEPACYELRGDRYRFISSRGRRDEWLPDHFLRKGIEEGGYVRNTWPIPPDPERA
jgi:hypothetical protein